MRKIAIMLSLAIFASCANNEKPNKKPNVVEGEILKVTSYVNERAPGEVVFIACLDAEQDGKRRMTLLDVFVTGKVAAKFNEAKSTGEKYYFVRLVEDSTGLYDYKELAHMNYDNGTPVQYQFDSDKKFIRN